MGGRGRLGAVVAAAVAVIVASSCSSGEPATAPTTTATSAALASTTSLARPPTTAGDTTTGPTTTATTAAPTTSRTTVATTTASTRCHTADLALSLGAPNAGAGNVYVPVVLTNTSSRTCQVAGYPGVSLLDASGAQIGSPATRDPGTVAGITLKPGATASTAMHTINPGIASGGCWPASAKVKVFPPNELNALTLGGKLTVCASRFSITPLVAGTSGAPG